MVGIATTKFSIKLSKGSNGKIKVEPIENKTVDVKPKASKLESDITKKVSLYTNIAESNFGIYEITIDGELYKIGKADLERITKSSGLPTRLHQQLRQLRKLYPKSKINGVIIEDLGKVTTKVAKTSETNYLQKYFNQIGNIPLGNVKSFKPN